VTSRRSAVDSFEALLEPFTAGVNAKCLSRTLDADFEKLAALLAPRADDEGGVLVVDDALLRKLHGVDARAVEVLLDDRARLAALGREPQLNVITHYPRDTRGLPMSVDVHSFHVDRAPVEADTFLCTYAGASSEGLDDEDAVRRIDDPLINAALRKLHGRDEDFADFLAEGSFDLHFAKRSGAVPFTFGVGHLWRLAVAWPGSPVTPCIHRAPDDDGRPRLMLIS
jgi:hypothetical protein